MQVRQALRGRRSTAVERLLRSRRGTRGGQSSKRSVGRRTNVGQSDSRRLPHDRSWAPIGRTTRPMNERRAMARWYRSIEQAGSRRASCCGRRQRERRPRAAHLVEPEGTEVDAAPMARLHDVSTLRPRPGRPLVPLESRLHPFDRHDCEDRKCLRVHECRPEALVDLRRTPERQ